MTTIRSCYLRLNINLKVQFRRTASWHLVKKKNKKKSPLKRRHLRRPEEYTRRRGKSVSLYGKSVSAAHCRRLSRPSPARPGQEGRPVPAHGTGSRDRAIFSPSPLPPPNTHTFSPLGPAPHLKWPGLRPWTRPGALSDQALSPRQSAS